MTFARFSWALVLVAALTGCARLPGPAPAPITAPNLTAALTPVIPARLPVETAARNFTEVVARIEPLAEATCREVTPTRNCDFQIGVDMTLTQPPNAYQTTDATGRPQIVFTIALIAEARNSDELAFVLGHEASHHILGHLDQTQQEALNGAILGGILASVTGADAQAVERAQQMGAQFGALRFSKSHELEADQLGTLIAASAGYDPVLGAQFFARLPDPGEGFLNSHPANAQRQAIVAETYAQIRAQ